MTSSDVFEAIEMYCNDNVSDIIDCTNDLLDNLRTNFTSFVTALDELVKEYADDNNCCPLCGEQLMTKTHKEKSEYQGCEVEEDTYEKECRSCGEVE